MSPLDLRVRGFSFSALALLVACASHEVRGLPPAIVRPAVEVRVRAWRQDLACFASELEQRHVAPFRCVSHAEFAAAVAALDARIPTLDDDGIVIELARLAATIGDGHTGFMLHGPRLGLRSGPLWLMWFADGVFVKGVRGDLGADVLNCRVLRVGGVPVEEAIARLAPLIPRDNEAELRQQAPAYLNLPRVLAAVGLTDELDAATFTFETDSGELELRCCALEPGASAVYVRYDEGSAGAPLAERLGSEPYAYAFLPGAAYIAYRDCHDDPARSFEEFCRDTFDLIDRSGVTRLVIDLRRNAGGDSRVVQALLAELERRPALTRAGHLTVLIGRGTFSSGVWAAIDLVTRFGAVLVGEPTGGRPNAPGHRGVFALPNSTLDVAYSRRLWAKGGRRFTGASLEPDVLVRETSREHFAGIDPALEAALARRSEE